MRKEKNTNGLVTLTDDEIIIGVELERFIPQGVDTNGNALGFVKVRPTNVTARIATVAGANQLEENSVILLSNGPHGGFTQQANLAAGNYEVNDVVRAVITNS